jgi:hypothetical protein
VLLYSFSTSSQPFLTIVEKENDRNSILFFKPISLVLKKVRGKVEAEVEVEVEHPLR